ncbi:molybdopterin molybdotransferase MoeA [Streptomyces poriferorum]|uniref:Molybdopterin molybdenumtransferase n=1 Tax=Streptomyces poriferorum TaxID=2798799 RepID=A0ABY9IU92_9ACTN|nr:MULTISPECIES: molybdopterin molybdotransferase MoeA [unclassified Streptomyces]MDP5313201.1 molybdopterin molybdotransferase MoeA [Streptomyces sp. Alt4]WLQ57809.1 molybdopterin molybdotransferase MoeA [Streptomyces sp. Alt2]
MTGHSGNADRNSAAEADEERAVAQALALVGRQAPPWAATGGAPGPGPAASGSSKDTPRSADPTWTAPAASPRDEDPATSTTATSTTATSATPAHRTGPDSPAPHERPRVRATPWHEARAVATRAGRGVPPRTVRLPLGQALGQVLSEPLAALTDLPSFDTSAMDGWAVAGPGPWTIRDDEGILAGHGTPAPLPDGDAIRIATGARIPADVTAVIRSEHAHADGAKGLLYAQRQVDPGQDIRPRGQECRSGDQLLPAGTLVTPAVLGLAAAAGYDELPTRSRPRVDVLVLGDELLTAGLPHDGLIRDALGPMIGPWLRALGAEVSDPRRLGDDAEALRQALTGSEADLIVTTGGTAAGPVDHVHPVLARIDAELLVDGVAVRPGHPMLLARLGAAGPYLVGLPGNPLAAVSGLLTLAEPLLRGLAGRTAEAPYRVPVRGDVHGHPHDTRLVPVVHRTAGALGPASASATRRDSTGTDGATDHVVPLHYNGPAMLRGVAAADGLAVVGPGGVRSGTEVEILDLPWAPATPWTEGCFT